MWHGNMCFSYKMIRCTAWLQLTLSVSAGPTQLHMFPDFIFSSHQHWIHTSHMFIECLNIHACPKNIRWRSTEHLITKPCYRNTTTNTRDDWEQMQLHKELTILLQMILTGSHIEVVWKSVHQCVTPDAIYWEKCCTNWLTVSWYLHLWQFWLEHTEPVELACVKQRLLNLS